jgi:hypothetical protein
LMEEDPGAMRILSGSRGKTKRNSVCSTFHKDTGNNKPVMYVEGWGKCTVGKHFVRFVTPLPPSCAKPPGLTPGPTALSLLMWCGHSRFDAGSKSLFHLRERFMLLPHHLPPVVHDNHNERAVRQRTCSPEEEAVRAEAFMVKTFDMLADVIHSNPKLESPQKMAESPREEPLLPIALSKTSKQSQPSYDQWPKLQPPAGSDVL